MEWLSELIKHITISRSFTGAVFVTATSVLFGSKWFPNYMEAPPKEWMPYATSIAIFSGALLLFWLFAALWDLCATGVSLFRDRRKSPSKLSVREHSLLQMLSDCEDETMDLNALRYGEGKNSKLEIHELVDQLAKRELLYRNGFGPNLVVLTDDGRRAVLAVQRAVNGGSVRSSALEDLRSDQSLAAQLQR